MTMYTIRVLLHGASSADYSNLAEYLRQSSIDDIVVGVDGKRYKMSPGEYSYIGLMNLDQVFEAVARSAILVGKPYAIMANQVVERTWVGLAPA